MKSVVKKLIGAGLLLCVCGCVSEVDMEVPFEPKVVVNCLLSSSPVQSLTLTYSRDIKTSDYYRSVDNADVALFEGDRLVGKFHKVSYDKWELSFTPSPNKNYRLEVDIQGFPPIRATTTFPVAAFIIRKLSMDNATDAMRYFEKVRANAPFWVYAFSKSNDTVMNPVKIDPSFRLFGEIGTDYPGVDAFNQSVDFNSDMIDRKTKEHFFYLRMLPDSSVRYFGLELPIFPLVVFRSVSHDYDMYLKSGVSKMLTHSAFDDNFRSFDEQPIYTNIENGLGIFGAYVDTMIDYNINHRK